MSHVAMNEVPFATQIWQDTYLYSKSTCKRSDNMSGMKLLRQLRRLPLRTFSISKCACYVSTVGEKFSPREVWKHIPWGWITLDDLFSVTHCYIFCCEEVWHHHPKFCPNQTTPRQKNVSFIYFFEDFSFIPHLRLFCIFLIFCVSEYSIYSVL